MNFLRFILRIAAIVLLGLTAVFTLMGGAGTTCVALAAEEFGEKWEVLVPYKWLYIIFVLTTIAAGVLQVRAVVHLIRSRPGAYRTSLYALISGIVIGVTHIVASRLIRGASMPVDAVVYTTVLTLIVFLLLRIPGVWKMVNFDAATLDKNFPRNAAAITLSITALSILTVQYWAGPTHSVNGVNFADAWHAQLTALGWGMGIAGLLFLTVPLSVSLAQRFMAGTIRRNPEVSFRHN
jgi:hypothetical protein